MSADHICGHFSRESRHARRANGSASISSGYPLARLELDSSGARNPTQECVAPENVLTAVSEGLLPYLRVVRFSHHLSWTVGSSCRKVHELAEGLQARAAVAGERGLSGDLPGVGAGPPKLEHFSLTGAVPASVIRESTLPRTLKSLHLSYFPFARPDRNHDLILGLGT